MLLRIKYFLFIPVLFVIHSCKQIKGNDKLLAKVYSTELYQSDVFSQLGEDTLSYNQREYIDSWIRNTLIEENSKLSPNDKKEIESLTESYKKTLIVQKQKEKYLNKNLDLEVDSVQLNAKYAELKESYKLRKDIFKYHLVVISKAHPEILDINNYFKRGEFDQFYESLNQEIEFQSLDSTKWQTWFDLSLHLPLDQIDESDLSENYNKSLESTDFIFFLRVFDYIDKSEIVPLSYMKRYLTNAIIEKRKENLLEEYSNELYNSALNNNKIIIN